MGYRKGSVCYVSKSGGMSNELNNIIARSSDGVCDGVAIGGDRYPGSRFIDHFLKYEANPDCKMIVLLGEVGGVDEYDVIEAVKKGEITKPVVAWCVGTCASAFSYDVQFGHAGAQARGDMEKSVAKNAAMKEAGIIVPASFNQLGEECSYAGVPISRVVQEQMGFGGAISLLWFRRRLPDYCLRFLEMCLTICADHGPAVSGAHNTVVCARAGKDLISSLCSGLLTIGPRFGGALDDAARMFTKAADSGLTANDFVNKMKKEGKLIMGIGHRVKSINNPDKRVTLISDFATQNFPSTPMLDYARQVEQITTKKKPNLILNVDGCIALCFVDLLRHSDFFTKDEAENIIKNELSMVSLSSVEVLAS